MKNTLLNFNEVQVDGPNSELFYINDFTNLYFSIPEKYTNNEMYYTNYLFLYIHLSVLLLMNRIYHVQI